MSRTYKEIEHFHSVEKEIQQRSRCKVYWDSVLSSRKRYEHLKSKYLLNRDLAMHKQREQSARVRYRTCFTVELKKYPEIYKHPKRPSRTIEDFEKYLQEMERTASECSLKKRTKVLRTELLNRGVYTEGN
ncbi:MAG: hypothetical protein KDD70_08855 [Bdellovibrionales bacterium]|nr:hypothetical protein [Bdellovibrionales bacterium]